MARTAIFAIALALWSAGAAARETVEASAPESIAVTIYRDPQRGEDEAMKRDWPRGFAMITETRRVTLPPGESTIRFAGVAEGMVAVSAIVTGLPGGTIEKNRNADLLSPAALVDGSLGNRVTVTRTNPATGVEQSESAIVRTRADGGLVLQTRQGFEAVRCSGLPERLSFDRVPQGLSAQPVYTIDTRDAAGGAYDIQLTYLAWGFDWQAHYVAQVRDRDDDAVTMDLQAWLTVLNDNGQSFPDAELLVVAGRLNVESDYRSLADPPEGRPLRLTCYPLGDTASGSAVSAGNMPPIRPAMPPMRMAADSVMVTASRVAAPAMKAVEEQLGDLKLYRVPQPVTVSAKGLKQVAFLNREGVEGALVYEALCTPGDQPGGLASMLFETVNDRRHGLGAGLPMGGITVFEPGPPGELLLAEDSLRDHAEGQDVTLELGQSAQVAVQCERMGEGVSEGDAPMRAVISNANPDPVTVRLVLGAPGEWTARGLRTRLKDGETVHELTVRPNARSTIGWTMESAAAAD